MYFGVACARYVDPGLDVQLAEAIVAKDCGVQLPRNDGGDYISILDECGGHTREYHFHERLSCLYKEVDQAHSAKVGQGKDGKGIYGKWEKFASSNPTLPKLDACGGHIGATPDSGGKIVYHYHVQQNPPFTVGCFGPDKDAAGKETLVTLDKCRALYEGCSGTTKSYATGAGTKEYKQWCPCYDGQGSNVGSAELAVFASGSGAITTCTDSNCASSGVAASDIASSPSTGGGGSGASAPSPATGAGGTARIHAAVAAAAAAAAALANVAGNAA